MGRTSDDGEVFGSKVTEHPLSPRRHQKGEDSQPMTHRKWGESGKIPEEAYSKGKKSRGLKGLQLEVGARRVPILLVLYDMMILYQFNTMVTKNPGELCLMLSLVVRSNRNWQNQASLKSSLETNQK